MLMIYTASEYNHRNQFLRTFRSVDFSDTLQLEYFGAADHTFTLLEDRKRLEELIEDWMLRGP